MHHRILIADDSPTMRAFLRRVVSREPTFEVTHAVGDGELALAAVEAGGVDAVVLDVEMPHMDGLAALDRIRALRPRLPVLVFSAHTGRGADATIAALAAGADEVVLKPSASSAGFERPAVGAELLDKLRALLMDEAPRAAAGAGPCALPGVADPPAGRGALGLAASTGGPAALEEVLSALPAGLGVPALTAQHMPGAFTGALARRLDAAVPMRVVEARRGAELRPGVVYVAPGGVHLEVVRRGGRDYVELLEPVGRGVCPSADVLFRSLAQLYGARATVAVLTGMGRDGLRGAREVRRAGGYVLVQDEASSTVWGMPGQVARAGLAAAVLPLSAMGPRLREHLGPGAPRAAAG